jgi:hypothetical protein
MNIPQIQMHSTFGRIEINTQSARLTIEQHPADLSIQQPKAEMTIEKTPGRLTIDQTKARADVGLKSARQQISEAAQQGQQAVVEGMARRAQEGAEMMKIENGGGKAKAIKAQAKRVKMFEDHEFNIGWVPSYGSVQMDYDPGRLDINWKINKPIIESQSHQPIINYYPGSIDIHMKEYPSLNIDVSI